MVKAFGLGFQSEKGSQKLLQEGGGNFLAVASRGSRRKAPFSASERTAW